MHFDIYILSKVRFWSVVNNQFILEKGREEEEGWGQGEPGEGGGGGVSGGEEVGGVYHCCIKSGVEQTRKNVSWVFAALLHRTN